MKRFFVKEYLKPVLIVLTVLIYWIFVYYPYHYSNYTAISFIVGGGILFFIGIYSLFFEKSFGFKEIKALYLTVLAFSIVSEILILIAFIKHGFVEEIDITWFWVYQNLGFPIAIFAILMSFISYLFILAGTYRILGKEHVYLWGMILIAWFVSNVRLLY